MKKHIYFSFGLSREATLESFAADSVPHSDEFIYCSVSVPREKSNYSITGILRNLSWISCEEFQGSPFNPEFSVETCDGEKLDFEVLYTTINDIAVGVTARDMGWKYVDPGEAWDKNGDEWRKHFY